MKATEHTYCEHCRKTYREHIDGKCLFDTTTFKPMPPMAVDWAMDDYAETKAMRLKERKDERQVFRQTQQRTNSRFLAKRR